MLVPYIIIGVMGGGQTLQAISGGKVPYWAGGAIVALVVMSYVFFGGMRGTAWVNTFQSLMFLCFGSIAFLLIGRNLGGFDQVMQRLAESPVTISAHAPAHPHAGILQLRVHPARLRSCFRTDHVHDREEGVVLQERRVIFYPIASCCCWLPSVFLTCGGEIVSRTETRRVGRRHPALADGETDVLLGLLGAAIMACVMASDSQILALCTMFTEDIFAYYGGKERFGEKAQVWTGRAFVVGVTLVAYLIALELKDKAGIFELAVRFAFTGFAALAPVMVAALYWKRSTNGRAAALWVSRQ
jgi:SSS family solute:Na+ symporter